jgi:hypothetical protein
VEEIKILIKDLVVDEQKEEKNFAPPQKIHPVDEIIERLYLNDFELDSELEILKAVKAATKKHNERTVEALDFVINYYDHVQARKIAAEGILNIGFFEFYPTAIIALLDEEAVVRKAINRYFLKYKDNEEVITELIKHKKYVESGNSKEYLEIFEKIIPKQVFEKISFKIKNSKDPVMMQYLDEITKIIKKD